jgi:hypothetical protein
MAMWGNNSQEVSTQTSQLEAACKQPTQASCLSTINYGTVVESSTLNLLAEKFYRLQRCTDAACILKLQIGFTPE